jgi:galactoside O-acetyltransferase
MSSFYSQEELSELGFNSVGNDVIVSKKASFYNPSMVSIGNNVRIDDFCILSAGDNGILIGNNIHIGAYSSLIGKGFIELGDFVNISARVSIYSSNDDYSGEFMTSPVIPEKFTNIEYANVSIGSHVIIGCGSIVLPGVNILEGVAVGAMSLVKSDCDAFMIYSGVPARAIKERSRQLLNVEKEFSSLSVI